MPSKAGKGRRRDKKKQRGFSHTLGDYGIGLPSALTVSQKRRAQRHKNQGGKERPPTAKHGASSRSKPVQEYQNSMADEQLAAQTAAAPGTNIPTTLNIPRAGGENSLEPVMKELDSLVSKTMERLQQAATSMSGAIDARTQHIVDVLSNREKELAERERKGAWKERAFRVGEYTLFGAGVLGLVWGGTHIVLGAVDSRRAARKAKLANPSGPSMPAMPA